MLHFHIAFFRGINVGKAKRIGMTDLRKLVEGLGYARVATVLNSGNVVFTTPRGAGERAARRIECAVQDQYGIASRVTVLSAEELVAAIEENPLLDRADNHSRLMLGVLFHAKDLEKVKLLLEHDWTPEALATGPRVVYYWCPDGILDSPVAAAVARALGNSVTSRNWATVLKLRELIR
jgi:uncharacterized protein (DUF1697 family)